MQELTYKHLLGIDDSGCYYKMVSSDGLIGALTQISKEEYEKTLHFWDERKAIMSFVEVSLNDSANRVQYDEKLRPYYVVDGERVYVDGTPAKEL